MYTSPVMRTVLVVVAVFSSRLLVSAEPINTLEIHPDGSMVERSVDERDISWMGHNGTGYWSEEDSFESDSEDLEKRGTIKSVKAKAATKPKPKKGSAKHTHGTGKYILDCRSYPEICANICYYQYCKGGSLDLHAKKGRTEAAACKKRPNKCSQKHKGPAGAYPRVKYQCDEFPLASTVEGGNPNSATRCLPARQNGGAGARFKFPAGTLVTTVLQNTGSAPFYCNKKCNTSKDKYGRQA